MILTLLLGGEKVKGVGRALESVLSLIRRLLGREELLRRGRGRGEGLGLCLFLYFLRLWLEERWVWLE